jgi:hypothetical protein
MGADRRDVRENPRRVRTDWDLGTSRFRAAWEVGDRSSFFQGLDPTRPAVQL